jgi:hypothetical protein
MSEEHPSSIPYEVAFEEPLDCANIFASEGIATGAIVLDEEGRFQLIGAGTGAVNGQLANITRETAARAIREYMLSNETKEEVAE